MLRTDYTTAGRVRRFAKIFLDLSCAFAKLVLLTTKHNVKASVIQAIILIDFNYFIITIFFSLSITCQKLFTEEPRFNEPLCNKILGIPCPSNDDIDMENNFHCNGTLL